MRSETRKVATGFELAGVIIAGAVGMSLSVFGPTVAVAAAVLGSGLALAVGSVAAAVVLLRNRN